MIIQPDLHSKIRLSKGVIIFLESINVIIDRIRNNDVRRYSDKNVVKELLD